MIDTDPLEALLPETLPLPLRSCIERALAETGLQRFNLIVDVYKAILQYVGAVAVGLAIRRGETDAKFVERLSTIIQPSFGDWSALIQLSLRPLKSAPGGTESLEALLSEGWLRQPLGTAARGAFEKLTEQLRRSSGDTVETPPRQLTVAIFFDRFIAFRNRSNLGHGPTGAEKDALAVGKALAAALPEIAGALSRFWTRYPLVLLDERVEAAEGMHVMIREMNQAEIKKQARTSSKDAALGHLFLREPGMEFVPVVDLNPLLVYRQCPECNLQRVFFVGAQDRQGARYLSFACGHQLTAFELTADLNRLVSRESARVTSPPIATTPALAIPSGRSSAAPTARIEETERGGRRFRRLSRRLRLQASRQTPRRSPRRVTYMVTAAVAVVMAVALVGWKRFGASRQPRDSTQAAPDVTPTTAVPTAPPPGSPPAPKPVFALDLVPTHQDLNAVWGHESGLVLAVGGDATLLRRDGNGPWQRQWPPQNVRAELFGIHGSDPDDLLVIGSRGLLLVGRDRARRWDPPRHITGEMVVLRTITARGASELLVGTDQGTILRSTDHAKTWQRNPRNMGNPLRGSSSFEDTAWMVGEKGTIVMTRDGVQWTAQRSNTTDDLNGVWAVSSTEAFAVGGIGSHPVFLHTIDGGMTWNREPAQTPNPPATVIAANDLLLAAGIGGTIVYRDPGGEWLALPAPTNTKHRIMSLWSGAGAIYAVGLSGTALRGR